MTFPHVSGAPTLESMRKERDRFVAFAFAAADILIEIDDAGIVCFADGATGGLLGVPPQSLAGKSFDESIVEKDRPIYANMLEALRHAQRMEGIRLTLAADPKPLPVNVSAFHLDRSGHLFLSISAVRDQQIAAELERRDMYSGFLNKEAFVEQASERIREAQAEGEELRLTLLDFPELKLRLDTMSSTQARQLVQEISHYLRSHSVDGDTAGTITEGNSYGVLHTPLLNGAEIAQAVSRLIQAADPAGKPIASRAKTIMADASSLTPQDSANALLYTLNRFAREKGEGFDIGSLAESYQEMLEDTVCKITRFKDVIGEEQFDIAFQPIVEIKNGVVHHFECLVRLKEGNTDFSNPFHFISFGEAAGLINDFDLLMLQKTIDVLMAAHKNGNSPRVSVNVSGKSLSSSLFMDSFEKLLANEPKVRKQVILEITESSKISDIRIANEFVQRLRKKGNLVCLDDFGTGESSFDYLRNLQVDFIKIDGSYVKESLQTRHGRDMLRAMASLCRNLGIVTIGEMVEDEKAAALLWEAGVRFGQGYLFGKPTIDTETLEGYNKPTPYFNGIMRAKRIRKSAAASREWWERRDN